MNCDYNTKICKYECSSLALLFFIKEDNLMGLNGKCKEHVKEWSSPLSMPIQPCICVFSKSICTKNFFVWMSMYVRSCMRECIYFEGFGKTTTSIQPIVQIFSTFLKRRKAFSVYYLKNPHKNLSYASMNNGNLNRTDFHF